MSQYPKGEVGAMPKGARAAGAGAPEPQASPQSSITIAEPMLRAACHALCQSGKFETGQGGCAAICMSILGSSRGGPHGCDYAPRVHGDLAASVLRSAGGAA